jgi:hypothetical protein
MCLLQISYENMAIRQYPGRTHRYVQVPVLYPFGHGLSYADFSHTITISAGANPGTSEPTAAWLSVKVAMRHTAGMAADQAVLLFLTQKRPLGAPSSPRQVEAACVNLGAVPEQPLQSLVSFNRLSFRPGEVKTVTFSVTAAKMAAFGVGGQVPCGRYYFRVSSTIAAVDIKAIPARRRGAEGRGSAHVK